MRLTLLLLFTFIFICPVLGQKGHYITRNGKVYFISEAPLETIEAESNELSGIINPKNNQFAFSIPIASFHGFNGPLQEEHFNENYLESEIYSQATFKGRIIEKVDLMKDGEYHLRAKGLFNIHGIEQTMVIDSYVKVSDGKLFIRSVFPVLLADFDIHIPRIVRQKISQEIMVNVSAELEYK
jgi:hypothetical protein